MKKKIHANNYFNHTTVSRNDNSKTDIKQILITYFELENPDSVIDYITKELLPPDLIDYSCIIEGTYSPLIGHTKFFGDYVQIYVIFKRLKNLRRIISKFKRLSNHLDISIPYEIPLRIRDRITRGNENGLLEEYFEPNFIKESGPCPGDSYTLKQYEADRENIFLMVEQGNYNDEILNVFPSAMTHLSEIDEYREYLLSDSEQYYAYLEQMKRGSK